jgi:hypothetical protein
MNANFQDNQQSEVNLNASMNPHKRTTRNLITITTTNASTKKKVTSSLPTFLVSNACHITNKLDELRGMIDTNDIYVAVITESWLTSNIPDSAVSFSNISTNPLDRKEECSRT